MTPIFIRIWLMKITMQLERLNLPKRSGCRSRHHAGGFP